MAQVLTEGTRSGSRSTGKIMNVVLWVLQVPKESFAGSFPGATEIAETFSYWEAHTYLGSDSSDRIALANKIAGRQPTKLSTWARVNFPVQAP